MAITWGSTTLSIKAETWEPNVIDSPLSETELLPDPDALTAVCSVIQQKGRTRARHNATLQFAAMSEYTTLQADMLAGTSRTLADGDTVNGTCYVEKLDAPKYYFSGYITAKITFVEG
jgi:hypothetical protein